jgi:hypothetical protein
MKGRDDEGRWEWGGEGGVIEWRKSVDMRNVPTACIGNESQHIIPRKTRGTVESDANFDTVSRDFAAVMAPLLVFSTIFLDTRISSQSHHPSLPCYPFLSVRHFDGTPRLTFTIE